MTNEEKVKYIEDRLDQYCVSNGSMNDRFMMSAFAYAIRQEAINEMNSKFREYLENQRNEYVSQRDNANICSEQWAVFHALACTLHRFITELFKED